MARRRGPHKPKKGRGGWYGESHRHSLAARGIRTAGGTPPSGRGHVDVGASIRRKREFERLLKEQGLLKGQGQPTDQLEAHFGYGGVMFNGNVFFKPTTDDPNAYSVLGEVGKLVNLQPTKLKQMEGWLSLGKAVYNFVAEPDEKGELAAIGTSLLNAGMCLAINIAEKHLVAWIAGAVGGPVPLILTVALTAAKYLR